MHSAARGGTDRPLLTFVGAMTLDALALVDQYPGSDERVVASTIEFAGGGPAATAAVAASRLGHEVAMIGAVGEDDAGEQIIAGLQAEGVRTDGVLRLPGARSGASVVVVTRSTATRAISNRPLPRAEITDSPAARELLAASAWVHTDHIGWAPSRSALAGPPSGPRTSFDGGHLLEGFTAQGLDLYVPTVDALQRRFGDLPVARLLELAGAESGGTVVATCGGEGAWILEPDGAPQLVPGVQVEVLSTLGAGDVFHGALLAQVAEGRPLLEAVRRSHAVAALSTAALDGRSAIPTLSELDARLPALTSEAPATSTIPEETP